MTRTEAGFRMAFRDAARAPAAVLCLSFIGFGVLCHGNGVGLAFALYTTIFMYALPGQVTLVDQIGRDMPLWTAALAVSLTGVRLLPMTIALVPYLRGGRETRPVDYLASHFVSVTLWIESMRRVPFLPRGLRLPFYFGLTAMLVGVSTLGTVAGYLIADRLPPIVAASLIFLTPVYFFMGLSANARAAADFAPILIGFGMAPFFMWLTPSLDLVLSGLVGGTVSFLLFRRKAASRAEKA
jgi:predicted branched-subunit amino acid permease